jgi:hypothetical protein
MKVCYSYTAICMYIEVNRQIRTLIALHFETKKIQVHKEGYTAAPTQNLQVMRQNCH